MQAVENQTPFPAEESVFIKQCREQGRLQTCTPAPLLGEQRHRFLALIQDMRRQGDSFMSQLSMLTLAGLNRKDQPETRQAIISNILRRGDIRAEQELEQLLWQARLILQLGEIYDLEQAGLQQAFEEISSRQDRLLATLCGDEANPFTLLTDKKNPDQEAEGIMRHRLRAWSRLCFHNANESPGLLITQHQTAVDLMQEVYEKRWQQASRFIATLNIPVLERAFAPNMSAESPLIDQCPNLTLALSAMSGELHMDDTIEQLFAKGLVEWSQATARRQDANTWQLDLFFFAGITAAALLTESFVADANRSSKGQESRGCVVGLLTTR